MLFDDDTFGTVELDLGGTELRRLAETMECPPSPELRQAIVAAADDRVRRLGRMKLSPYRLHASLQSSRPEATPAQVAHVLLAWCKVSG